MQFLELNFSALLVDDRSVLSPFLGAILRGAFGRILRQTVCQVKRTSCDDCLLHPACPHPAIFEGLAPDDRQILRKYRFVPQPFVLVFIFEGSAEELGCSQSRVSKIENGFDADLGLRDIAAYAKVVGRDFVLLDSPRGMGLAHQVKYHALKMRDAMHRLVELAHTDDEIVQGVARLHVEAFVNIMNFLRETSNKLPACSDSGEPYVRDTSWLVSLQFLRSFILTHIDGDRHYCGRKPHRFTQRGVSTSPHG